MFDCTNNTLFGMYFMQVVKKCNDYTRRAVEKKASKKCTLCQDYICSVDVGNKDPHIVEQIF